MTSIMTREQCINKALFEKLADQEGLIARGSINATRLTRYHIFNLCTQGLNKMGLTWDEVNSWFEGHRPEIPEGRF